MEPVAIDAGRECGGHASAWLDARLRALEGEEQPFNQAALSRLDIDEAFPEQACRALDELGLAKYYVPAELGGRLDDYSELCSLWRTLSRRDLTVAIAHGKTFLGAVSCWLAGSSAQREALARQVAAGAVIAWGLTERGHGSDLLASEFRAERSGDGYRLNGEKWLINNATRASALVVLGRTAEQGGARGMGLLLVDKTSLAPGSFECSPKQPTHGIRGADISGIRFNDAHVPRSALIGAPGAGIEIVLAALQLTRTLSVGLSLGALDHALELALAFTSERKLYGRQLSGLPYVQRALGEAAAARLAAEATATVAARSIQTLTAELALTAAIAKAFIPALADEAIAGLGELLGARAFLCGVFAEGRFQKLRRDHRIVPIFDGSTVINRHVIVNHFPMLARSAHEALPDTHGLAATLTLREPLSPLIPGRLQLVARRCSLLNDLHRAVLTAGEDAVEGKSPPTVAMLGQALAAEYAETRRAIEAATPARHPDPSSFVLAERVELCWAGAACLELYCRNRAAEPQPAAHLWEDGLWVRAALTWILARLRPLQAIDLKPFEALGALLSGTGVEAAASLFPEQRAAGGPP